MKLINNRYEQQLDFDTSFAWFLIVENSKEYLKVIQELYGEFFFDTESDFVLSEQSKILNIPPNCLFIYNFFDLDLNNKKITGEINSRVADIFTSKDFIAEFYKINQLFVNINDRIVDSFNFKLEYDSDLTYDKFIKLAKYRIGTEINFIERLMSYIKIYGELKNIKLVIFVGLSDFLSQQEMALVLKELNYLNLKCLFIESHQKYFFDFTRKIIIDKDLCEI